MILERLGIERLPGLTSRLEIDFGPRLTVVHGPNASGKSSLVRALHALLFADEDVRAGRGVVATARFADVEPSRAGQASRIEVARDGSGASRWQQDGRARSRPQLPPSFYAPCYLLRAVELLAPTQHGALEAELRRRLQGGHDLVDLGRDFAVGPRAGQHEARALEVAVREARKEAQAHDALARREGEVEALELRRRKLSTAGSERAILEVAIDRVRCLQSIAELEARRARMPSGVAALDGSEIERLVVLDSDLDDVATLIERADQVLARCDQRAKALARATVVLDEALGTDDSEALRSLLAEVERRFAEARRARQAFDAARARFAADAACVAASRALTARDFEAVEAQFARELDFGVRAKLHTSEVDSLRAAQGLPVRLRASLQFWIAVVLAVFVGVLAVRALLRGAGEAWLFGGVALAAALFLVLARGDVARVVTEHFAERRRFERERLTAAKARLLAEKRLLQQQRKKLEATLGFELPRGAAASLDLARARDRARLASEVLSEQREQVAIAEAAYDDSHAELNARLQSFGVDATGRIVDDRALVLATLHASDQVAKLHDKRKEALGQRVAAEERRARLDARRDDLLESRGFAASMQGRAELERAMGFLAEFREVERELAVARARLAEFDERLADALLEGRPLRDLSLDELRTAHAAAEAQVAEQSRIETRLVAIRTEVALARESERFAKARARVDEAREAVERVFDEALDGAAAGMLLGRIRERLARDARPPLVVRAAELFAYFTHERYEVLVHEDEGGDLRFAARDHGSGATLALDQLSDGTRSQLLLAWRLALVFVSEGAVRLPVFLDEVLAHCDEARFAAIAEALLRLAEVERRQFVVLTADAADVTRLERTARQLRARGEIGFDITLVELSPSDVALGRDVVVPPLPARKRFEGAEHWSPEAWWEHLAPEPLTVWQDPSRVSLVYILVDHGGLLARLCELGATTLGAYEALRRRGAKIWPEVTARHAADLATADLACELVKRWCALVGIGRGRPLQYEDLDGLEALTQAFESAAGEALTTCSGDAARWCASMAALPRFVKRRADLLHDELIAKGFIDPRPVLDKDERLARVLATQPSDVFIAASVVARLEAGLAADDAQGRSCRLRRPASR